MSTNWHRRWLERAWQVAAWSKDQSTKVGAVIVRDNIEIASGYNGFPRGVNDDLVSRHLRPAKYLWTEHAERNALYNALRKGVSVEGATLYLNYAPFPCADCTRGLIQAGIVRIITGMDMFPGVSKDKWDGHFEVAQAMLDEASIPVIMYSGEGR